MRTANLNRLANAKNPWQGNFKKVLCVCSAGLLRSPTIAWILSNKPYNCNTRACGISQEYALIPLDAALIYWADEIVCAHEDHYRAVKKAIEDNKFTVLKKPIYTLDIEDEFKTRDPKLIKIIQSELERVYFKGTTSTK